MLKRYLKASLIIMSAFMIVILWSVPLKSGGRDFVVMIREEIKRASPKTLRYEEQILTSIANATYRQIIEPPLITAIMTNESEYKIKAKSNKDARGLMQLVKSGCEHAEWMTGIKFLKVMKSTNGLILRNKNGVAKLEVDQERIYDIDSNIRGGVALLEWLATKYPLYYEDGTIDIDSLGMVIELYNVGWGNYHGAGIRNSKYVNKVIATYERHRKIFYDTFGSYDGFQMYCDNINKNKRRM